MKVYKKFLRIYLISIFLTAVFVFLFAGCQVKPQAIIDYSNQQDSGADTTEPTGQGGPLLNANREGNFIADGIISDNEYSNFKNFEGFEIFWSNDDEYAYIAMRAETPGFVSIGIQPGNLMKDADMIFGFLTDTGAVIYDLYSTGNFGPHPPDIELGGTDDILDFDGNFESGYTLIEFKRRLVTGDKYDNDLVAGTNKIIWAYGSQASLDGRHLKRGYGEIEIK